MPVDRDAVRTFARHAQADGVVLLAGAGVSMDPPSSLPGWLDLNRMILDALRQRVASYLEEAGGQLDAPFDTLLARRDRDQTFAPDYQAQVMEEQCGETYFRVLQSLDVGQRNVTHEAVAALAAAGRVRAIVTTNFDRLLELALGAHGVRHRTYADAPGYEELSRAVATGDVGELPVVKIHGSVEDVSSLVDTLRQRLRGRGPALQAALDLLLRRHYWVYCGFSGADLDFDPGYLGILGAAGDSPGFAFVHRPDSPPRASVVALGERYGAKASFVAATLAEWFDALLDALALPRPATPATAVADPRAEVAARIERWADGLHAMEAVNVLSALLEAGGQEPAALWLLHRVWRWARLPQDTSGPHYSRYLFNYGRLALNAGETTYEETPQNFLRARDDLPEALAGAGLFFTYVGMGNYARAHFSAAADRTIELQSPALEGDVAVAFARFADLYGEHEAAIRITEFALPRLAEDGDAPRRARVLAISALIRARAGQIERALAEVEEAGSIARRIGDDVLRGELLLARGVAEYARADLEAARAALRQAAEIFADVRRAPLLVQAQLEWMKAAYEANDVDEAWELYQAAERLVEPLRAFIPRLYFLVGRMYAFSGQPEDARRNYEHARSAAEACENPWMVTQLERALTELPDGGARQSST